MNSISLSELTTKIRHTINQEFDSNIWVRAEISEMHVNNGHCYMELIEKEADSDNILAKMRATCWASTFRMLKPYFESSTGETFRAGLKVLVSVLVEFSGLYSISLNVRDIDPVFTIGELAARRLQIIRQLNEEGIADMNKQLLFPELPQRIAVISSETAAGYGDFCDQLKKNAQKYVFYPKLFPAIMQGSQAEQSIIQALEKIFSYIDYFDVVVIIRGGGATTDLSCFDSYNIALNCTQFPLPIIAGIGHQRDITILDMVAHTSVKTPTAAAEFLIEKLSEAESTLDSIVFDISESVKNTIQHELNKLEMTKLRFRQALKHQYLMELNLNLKYIFRLKNLVRNRIVREENKLKLLHTKIETYSPNFLVERGYSITTKNGIRLTSTTEINSGDKIETHLPDGSFSSKVLESK
ncbi:MAG: exodeoxyribonuclease VII large subunit [Porphyromonadaceae bacterium]|jgi:exodeoxyribonuclease VII large subunit|nr:exodeoxyribonuclease VII large subunit [Porphyromonadaceae bacterium]